MSPFLARRQYNLSILYIGIQRVACTNIESAAKRSWKNNLPLGGNFRLHGKTILPPLLSLGNGHHLTVLFRKLLEDLVVRLTKPSDNVERRQFCSSPSRATGRNATTARRQYEQQVDLR